MLPLHASAVLTTIFLVLSGFDWKYCVFVLSTMPDKLLLAADISGYVFAVFVPLGLLLAGWLLRNSFYRLYAEAVLFAVVLGFTLSTFIKMFTGRTSPPHSHHGGELILIDNSHTFHFGFMQEQIIGGWPSSHATIMFALATTMIWILPSRWYIRALLFSVALFVGIRVTFGFHWLSEFVAGALLGIAVGLVVGKYYKGQLHQNS